MKYRKKTVFVLWCLFVLVMCAVNIKLQTRMEDHIRAKCTHLAEYYNFRSYNQNHFFNDFLITESWDHGEPFYLLSAEWGKIKVCINKEQTKVRVEYMGQSVVFPVGGFLSTNANLYLADLTGDGTEEVIYEEPMSGAGENAGSLAVVDLRSMELLPVEDSIQELLSKIRVEVVSEKNNMILCKVTDDSHHICFGTLNSERTEQEGDWIEENDCHAIEYDMECGKLKTFACFTLNGCKENSFLGEISAYYQYNQNTRKFELEKESTVTLWSPVTNNGMS